MPVPHERRRSTADRAGRGSGRPEIAADERARGLLPRHVVRSRIWIVGLLLATALPLAAGPDLTLTVSPRQPLAPAIVWVRVRIEPHPGNRTIEFVAESDEFYRSSQIPLDGARAPRSVAIEWRGLPAGDYMISGILTDDAGRERASARQEIVVVPSGRER